MERGKLGRTLQKLGAKKRGEKIARAQGSNQTKEEAQKDKNGPGIKV